MSSTNFRAARTNPKSFVNDLLDYGPVKIDHYIGGIHQYTQSSLIQNRDWSQQLFGGVVLDDFHKRKNSGELLPATFYQKVDCDPVISGPNLLSWGFTEPSDGLLRLWQATWLNGSTKPVNITGHGKISWLNKFEALPGILGIDPQIYPTRSASRLYSRGWDGATFAAEFGQVIRMFRSTFMRFYHIIDEWIAYRRKHPNAQAVQPLNEWLQARYGWRVLIYDIKDINDLLDNIGTKSRTRVKERTGDRFSYTEDLSSVVGASHKRTITDTISYDLSVRGSVIADFIPSRVILNPIVTAWELVPYSFVIDWFYSIGTALNALSFLSVNPLYSASYGYYCEAKRSLSVSVSYGPGWVSPFSNADQYAVTEEVTWNLRKPVYVSALPRIDVNLNLAKVADLIALLGQLIYNLARR